MRAYLQRSIETALRQLFPADDAETALSWWIASEGRSPVVVVGAGFTRNARDRLTGRRISSAHVPLWADVLQRFEADLGGKLEGIDALTIAELHAEALGTRRHVDLLLEMLPDDRLDLGAAHEALFDLRPAAIVTTNFLDTVLDRHPRALAIFDDTSAATCIDTRDRTEIIYLHGHRSAPASWVLTRSQYDGLEESRPVLLTRVRQLFAQHPILTLGFGLADPDFHQIQGQIHARMAGYQPLGLTLLGPADPKDRTSRPESALRGHWEKRRLRIVRFGEGDFETNLSDFLRLPGKMDFSACERLLREERGFRRRAEFARSLLHDADAEKRVEAEYGWQARLWRTCLDADFTDAERASIRERWNAAVQASMPAAARPASASDPNASGRAERARLSTPLLNDGPGFRTWELAWVCDGWWGSARDRLVLVDWLHERVVHRDWPMRGPDGDADIRIAELLLLLIESLPADVRPMRAAADAMRLLRRYDPETSTRLAEKFPALRDHAQSGPADPLHDVDRQMAEGLRASMNGDHARATDAYHRAYEAAQRASDPLVLWLAAQSRRYAHDLRQDPVGSPADERGRLTRRYLAEEREAVRHPKVVEWQSAADERVLKLRKLTVEDLQQERRRRAFEGMHVRLDSVLHLAWRTLRDLEELGAHPILQVHYMRPLLDHGFGEISTEAAYRLTFDVARFREWVREVIEDGASHDRAVYDQRSHAMVSAWLSLATETPSVSVLVGCVKGIVSLLSLARTDDIDKIGGVLAAAPKAFAAGVSDRSFHPSAVKTFNGAADTTSALMHAWATWLAMRGQADDFAAFMTWATTLRPPDLFDAQDGIRVVRWETLVRGGVLVDDVVAWLCTTEHLTWVRTAHRARFGEPLAILLWRLADAQPDSVSQTTWNAIGSALASMLPESAAAMAQADGFAEGDDLVRAGFGVLATWERFSQRVGPALKRPAALRTLRARLERLVPAFLRLRKNVGHPALTLAQLWVASDVRRFDRAIAAPEIQALATKLDHDWPQLIAHCKRNRGEVRHAAAFLAAIVETTSAASSLVAQGQLHELVVVSSSALDSLWRVLHPRLWSAEAWAQLVQLLREATNGARGRFPGSARTDACDLVRHALLHTRQPLPADLHALTRNVMDLTAHEDATVANHAAYAAVALAEWGIAPADSTLAQETAKTVRAIASDPRPGVRGAAAYALGFVGRSKHAELRELARSLASLAEDPYAQVRGEWLAGQRRTDDSRQTVETSSPPPRRVSKRKLTKGRRTRSPRS
jgi:hypothetical protein